MLPKDMRKATQAAAARSTGVISTARIASLAARDNKFRKLGFIEYNGALKVDNSLLSVVLRD